jgi:hypothetical protein
VAAGLPHHPVTVPDVLGGLALSPGGAEGDVEAGGGPAASHLVDVELRASGLHVVQIAPREHVDAADAGGGRQVPDLREPVAERIIGVIGSCRVVHAAVTVLGLPS